RVGCSAPRKGKSSGTSLLCSQGLGGVSWPGEQQRPLIGRSPSVSHTQGTIQAFEIQKSHCESTQAGNNPFLYVCVCPKWMGGLQPVLPLLTEGTSLSRALSFCTHSWRTDSATHPPASLTL
ncbi:EIF4E2 isoform 3, partial [Pan troglodytes]